MKTMVKTGGAGRAEEKQARDGGDNRLTPGGLRGRGEAAPGVGPRKEEQKGPGEGGSPGHAPSLEHLWPKRIHNMDINILD